MLSTLKQRPGTEMAQLAAKSLCVGYWVGFSSNNTEHDPITMASFYKETGNN